MSPRRDRECVIVHGGSEGVVKVLREAVIETFDGARAVVISRVPIPVGDRVRLCFRQRGTAVALDGRVVTAALAPMHESLCHRLTIAGQVAAEREGPIV